MQKNICNTSFYISCFLHGIQQDIVAIQVFLYKSFSVHETKYNIYALFLSGLAKCSNDFIQGLYSCRG